MSRKPRTTAARRAAGTVGEDFTPRELALLEKLRTPAAIQDFLDRTPYSDEPVYRSPRSVMRDRKAHCFDGAVFAAAALERLGYPPLLVDMRAWRDDDHVLALFREKGGLGAIAKSNFTGLRFRDPIHRNVRELGLAYFDAYYNMEKKHSLRAISGAIDLRRFDRRHWRTDDRAMDAIAERLDGAPHQSLLTAAQVKALRPVDDRTFRAGLLGANPKGIYFPD